MMRPRSISATPPPSRRNRSFICRLASVTIHSPRRWISLRKRALISPESFAAGRLGKMRSPYIASKDVRALESEDWLSDQGVKNIKNVNGRLSAAKPWFSFYGVNSVSALA